MEMTDIDELEDAFEHPFRNPAEEAAQIDEEARMRRAPAVLPDDLRDVVCQRIYAGLTFRDIARISRIPIGTALWRMRRFLEVIGQGEFIEW